MLKGKATLLIMILLMGISYAEKTVTITTSKQVLKSVMIDSVGDYDVFIHSPKTQERSIILVAEIDKIRVSPETSRVVGNVIGLGAGAGTGACIGACFATVAWITSGFPRLVKSGGSDGSAGGDAIAWIVDYLATFLIIEAGSILVGGLIGGTIGQTMGDQAGKAVTTYNLSNKTVDEKVRAIKEIMQKQKK